MRKIYIVQGSTGEYSDHYEWMVAAYLSEASAANRVSECQAFANEVFQRIDDKQFDDEDKWEALVKSGPDPSMQCDYTGVRYSLHAVDLIDG